MVLLLTFFLNDFANVFEIHIVEARIVVKMKGRMIKVELLENSEKSADLFKLISRFLLVLFLPPKSVRFSNKMSCYHQAGVGTGKKWRVLCCF